MNKNILLEEGDLYNFHLESNNSSDESGPKYKPKKFSPKVYMISLLRRSILSFLLLALITLICNFMVRDLDLPNKIDSTNMIFNENLLNDIPELSIKNGTRFKMDFHLHTTKSDGKLKPQQVVDWAVVNGYDIIAITDHNKLGGIKVAQEYAKDKYNGKILVLPGVEYTNCRVHMNLININITEKMDFGNGFPTDEEIKNIIKQTHKQGGIAIINHLPWSMSLQGGRTLPRLPNHPSLKQLIDWGIDGVEIINGKTYDKYSSDYLKNNNFNLIQSTGTDLHDLSSAHAWTILNGESLKLDPQSIINYLKNNKQQLTNIFYPIGTPVAADVRLNFSYPWVLTIEILSNIFNSFFDLDQGMYSFHGSFCHETIWTFYYAGIFMFFIFILMITTIVDLFYFVFNYFISSKNIFRSFAPVKSRGL